MEKTMDKKLGIPNINYDMPITDLLIELEKLRYKELRGTTNPIIFHQLRYIFQMLESIGSSRIEGNNTTILDYVETTRLSNNSETVDVQQEQINEILNIEKAMSYIEENIYDIPITLGFIRELHILTVDGLSYRREGAAHPGQFRESNVRIGGASHIPPDYTQVAPMMQELIDFVNQAHAPKYDLLKIAIAHHRFVWIHPFENGNGRVVRLFTYALLLKYIFQSKQRIINPTAVFCADRESYYYYLSKADEEGDEGIIEWAHYMLRGLKSEIEKIDILSDYEVLKGKVLMPALEHAEANKYITPAAYAILNKSLDVENQIIQSSDLKSIMPASKDYERSRAIKALIKDKLLTPITPGGRKYIISFNNNYLMRSVLVSLDKAGFLPQNSLGM